VEGAYAVPCLACRMQYGADDMCFCKFAIISIVCLFQSSQATYPLTPHLTTPRFDAALTSEAGHPAADSAGVVESLPSVQQQVDDVKQRLQTKGNRQIYKARLCRFKVKVISLLPSALL